MGGRGRGEGVGGELAAGGWSSLPHLERSKIRAKIEVKERKPQKIEH